MRDYHVIEALGKTEVVIENGQVTSVGEPLVDYCPIFDKIDAAKHLTPEFIKWNIEKRIREFGMCTPQRVVRMDDVLSFGISEILRTNFELGLIDCVVGVCEGVGTLLMTDPEIIQGVGGRVSALISTTPIPEVIKKVGVENVVNNETAELTPIKGLEIAIEKGYKNIAITILPGNLIKEIADSTIKLRFFQIFRIPRFCLFCNFYSNFFLYLFLRLFVRVFLLLQVLWSQFPLFLLLLFVFHLGCPLGVLVVDL